MNDLQFSNIQVAIMKANSVIPHLDMVCRDCESKEKCNREIQRCGISQAKVKLVMASLTLSEIMEKERKVWNE